MQKRRLQQIARGNIYRKGQDRSTSPYCCTEGGGAVIPQEEMLTLFTCGWVADECVDRVNREYRLKLTPGGYAAIGRTPPETPRSRNKPTH